MFEGVCLRVCMCVLLEKQLYFLQNQKQPSRDVLRRRCSENMQQIYRETAMSKCDFNKVA